MRSDTSFCWTSAELNFNLTKLQPNGSPLWYYSMRQLVSDEVIHRRRIWHVSHRSLWALDQPQLGLRWKLASGGFVWGLFWKENLPSHMSHHYKLQKNKCVLKHKMMLILYRASLWDDYTFFCCCCIKIILISCTENYFQLCKWVLCRLFIENLGVKDYRPILLFIYFAFHTKTLAYSIIKQMRTEETTREN